jgi:hypothetical protein
MTPRAPRSQTGRASSARRCFERTGVGVASLLVFACLAGARNAAAQTTSAPKPSASPSASSHRPEIDIGFVGTGGVDLGSNPANETTPTGGTQPLFTTSNRMSAGSGLEATMGIRLVGGLLAGVSAGWSHTEFQSTLNGDFEGAAPVTATLGASLFSVEGSAAWVFHRSGKMQPFVRASAGWLRELTEGGVLASDGSVANVGGGVKYWWRDRAKGAFRRFGFRSELRVTVRSGTVMLGTSTKQVAPAVVLGALIGF